MNPSAMREIWRLAAIHFGHPSRALSALLMNYASSETVWVLSVRDHKHGPDHLWRCDATTIEEATEKLAAAISPPRGSTSVVQDAA